MSANGHPNRSHWWAGNNGWSCVHCGKWRWQLPRAHSEYRYRRTDLSQPARSPFTDARTPVDTSITV